MIDTIGLLLLAAFPPPIEYKFVGNIIDNYGLEIHVEVEVRSTGGLKFERECWVSALRGGELRVTWFDCTWQGTGLDVWAAASASGGAPYGCRLVDDWVVIKHQGVEIFRMYAPYYEPVYEEK